MTRDTGISMADDAILLPMTYEVPLIWHDRAHDRERLAVDVAQGQARLRRVHALTSACDRLHPERDVVFEGRSWRPYMAMGGRGVTLERFRMILRGDGLAPPSFLCLDLPHRLTTIAGTRPLDGASLLPRVDRSVVERLDAEALANATRVVEQDTLYDGNTILYPTGTRGLTDAQRAIPEAVHTALGPVAINVLEHTTDLAGRFPEIALVSHAVRRIAIRGSVHAIAPPDMADAARTLLRLVELAYDATNRRAVRRTLSGAEQMLTQRVLPLLVEHVPAEDVGNLSDLAP